jgi:hypothetical protein
VALLELGPETIAAYVTGWCMRAIHRPKSKTPDEIHRAFF